MHHDKKEITNLIDSIGNEPMEQKHNNNFNWFQENNTFEEPIDSQKKKKPGCKSGKCGNNTWGIIVAIILALLLMLAGHGLFELLGL
jgi:hypothetical protein